MAIERFYTQTANIVEETVTDPDNPIGGDTVIYSNLQCWINNTGGQLTIANEKRTVDFDAKLKCSTNISLDEKYKVIHNETGARYDIERINNASGYKNHHYTVYLRRVRNGSQSN